MLQEILNSVLIVEDNILYQQIIKKFLSNTGIQVNHVFTAVSLAEVKLATSNNKPDVIILDLNLTDSEGLETFIKINSLFPEIPIIVLSGMSDTEIALQSISLGAQDYLLKGDFDVPIFKKTILYSIERKKNQLKINESNQRYEIVSKATNDPIWDMNLQTNEIHWNDKVSIFGYAEDVLKNREWFISCIHKEDVAKVSMQWENLLKGKIDQWTNSYRFLCSGGTYKHILDRGFILRNGEGKPLRMICSMLDITERKKSEEALEARCREIRQLSEYLQKVREEERAHMAREIHDELGQQLTVLKIDVSSIAKKIQLKEPEVFLKCTDLLGLIDNAVKTVRKIASELRPSLLDDLGLVAALGWYGNEFEKRFNIKVNFSSNIENLKISENLKINLFRIYQESLTNIARHSGATEVNGRFMATDEGIFLTVSDNGKGFDIFSVKGKKTLGILGMKERAQIINANYNIQSTPGKGTAVEINIPACAYN